MREWEVELLRWPVVTWAEKLNTMTRNGWTIFNTSVDNDIDEGGLIVVMYRDKQFVPSYGNE